MFLKVQRYPKPLNCRQWVPFIKAQYHFIAIYLRKQSKKFFTFPFVFYVFFTVNYICKKDISSVFEFSFSKEVSKCI